MTASFDAHTDDGAVAERAASPGTPARRRLDLDTILRGAREVIIRHDGQDYRLRLTNNDRLLLTK